MANGAHGEMAGSRQGRNDAGDGYARFVANGAHGEVASSRHSRNDAGDSPVRTHIAVTASMLGIIECELAVSNIVAFGVVDGNLI